MTSGKTPRYERKPRQGPPRDDLTLRLHRREDKHGNTYFIARGQAPIFLDMSRVTIFVFTGDRPELSFRITSKELPPPSPSEGYEVDDEDDVDEADQ